MSLRQAEWWLSCWISADWVEPETWYEALAVLMAERSPA